MCTKYNTTDVQGVLFIFDKSWLPTIYVASAITPADARDYRDLSFAILLFVMLLIYRRISNLHSAVYR